MTNFTNRQIAFAKEHDWYVGATADKMVIYVRLDDGSTGEIYNAERLFVDYAQYSPDDLEDYGIEV